jgi:FAD-dependent oxidoreductase domain-containing protein 1
MTMLNSSELKSRFPWLKTDDVLLGSVSEKNEGWFDPWGLLASLNAKAKSMGVTYVNGEVTNLKCATTNGSNKEKKNQKPTTTTINKVVYRDNITQQEVEIGAGIVVNAAGPFSKRITSFCGDHVTPLPVEARRRSIFQVHCDNANTSPFGSNEVPGYKNTPLVVCPGSGAYFRPEGGVNYFICGVSPSEATDVNCSSYSDLDVGADHELYENIVWPGLYERCEAFESLKVKSSWVGFYEYNTLDQVFFHYYYHPFCC